MKKKLLVLILLFAIAFMPLSAFAASNTITYNKTEKKFKTLKIAIGNGKDGDMFNSNTDWTKRIMIRYGTGANSLSPQDGWTFHKMTKNGENVYGYCAGVGQYVPKLNTTSRNGVDLSDLRNVNNVKLTEKQVDLLKEILSFGPQYNVSNAASINVNWEYDIIATQILIWETIEGGRDDITGKDGDQFAPNLYNGDDSAYRLIVKNKLEDRYHSTYYNWKVYDSYTRTITRIKNARTVATSSSAGSTTTLKWNYNTAKYTATIDGLGRYANNCTPNTQPNGVTLESKPSGTSIIVTSNKWFDGQVTFTCSYREPENVTNTSFYYYEYDQANCDNNGENRPCQKLLYGKQSYPHTITLNVNVEKQNLKIVKQDSNGNKLSGSKFKLSNNHGTLTYELDGNGSAIVFQKSSDYKLTEITTPNGYKTMDTINSISFDVKGKKVTACDNYKKSGNVVYCGKDRNVAIEFIDTDNTFVLTITNDANNFEIIKYNDKGATIPGAKFIIESLNRSGALKFKKASNSNLYTYDTNGTITELTGDVIKISALPKGEYALTEIEAPAGYLLTKDIDERTYRFKIGDDGLLYEFNKTKYNTSDSESIPVINYKSTLTINKTGKGKSLENVKFALYNEDKTTILKCELKNNAYENCSTNGNQENNLLITNASGKIVINGLPEGTYYLKEVETIDPFVIPEGDAAYTKIDIKIENNKVNVYQDGTLTKNYEIPIDNSPNTFTFYKKNENGELISGGTFKLLYKDKEGHYHGVRIKAVNNDGTYDSKADIYEPDDKASTLTFSPTNGIVTFINLTPSTTYKIVEVTPPKGYPTKEELQVDEIGIEFKIDKYGRSVGASTLVNEKLVIVEGDSSAELIVNIQTGMDRVRYILIIGGVILLIGISVVIIKKLDKKKK